MEWRDELRTAPRCSRQDGASQACRRDGINQRHGDQLGLPWWLRQKRICLQCRRPGFDPWVKKLPWRRGCQSIPVFLLREFHGQNFQIFFEIQLDCWAIQSMRLQRVGHSSVTNTHRQGDQLKAFIVQSCPILCDPMDCSPPGSSIHGIS